LALTVAALLILRSGDGSAAAEKGTAPSAVPSGAQQEVRPAARLTIQVLATYPHDPDAYTQGLLWHGGELYESTGQWGQSSLRRVRLQTGDVLESVPLPRTMFGEGLALVEDRLFQLTWRNRLGKIWSLSPFQEVGEFRYEGEGWGLCYDGGTLIMTDGGSELSFRDARTFDELRRLEVTAAGRPVRNLNELECVGGEIYANLYGSNTIARIDGATGQVTAFIDASGLLTAEEEGSAEVLNGIAYVPERGTFLLTGKYWPKLFEVTFVAAGG
jgi:glutamine cyclotransferase